MLAKLMGWRALLDRADTEVASLRKERDLERAEVKRLTDVIVHLKHEGMVLDPVQSDERWPGGKYSIDEIERQGDGSSFEQREAELADKELQAELDEVLKSGH